MSGRTWKPRPVSWPKELNFRLYAAMARAPAGCYAANPCSHGRAKKPNSLRDLRDACSSISLWKNLIGKLLRMATGVSGNSVVFSVQDSGSGISIEDQDRIFDTFF